MDVAKRKENREKRWVALSSVVAAIFLTGTKLGIGIWTNSLGILSEAAHSGLDLVAAAVTFWAVRAASAPADSRHTYGHGKHENLAALFETVLLLVTCVWIVWEAVHRLMGSSNAPVEANLWAFGTVLFSIVVDISRSRALKRTADKYQSQALEADALHFSTDVWSSCVVLVGLGCVRLGAYLGKGWEWLERADAVAALGVALIVVWVSLQLGKKSVDDLLDAIPSGLHGKVTAAAKVEGVEDVRQVRLRRSGPEYFVDVILAARRGNGFEHAHAIADRAQQAVLDVLPRADVVVHMEPISCEGEGVLETARSLAHAMGMEAHAVRVREESDGSVVELHLEVEGSLSLEEGHSLASRFEKDLQEAHPTLSSVITHLEPAGGGHACVAASDSMILQVQNVIRDFLENEGEGCSPHDLQVTCRGDVTDVCFHCSMDGRRTVAQAHDKCERLETHLRSRIARLGHVVVHLEPPDAE